MICCLVVVLVASFLHNVAFTNGTFFLALYFQVQNHFHRVVMSELTVFQAVHGASPLMAGVFSLPYSLGSSLASMPAAWYISSMTSRENRRKEIMSVGLAISSLGFGRYQNVITRR